MNFFQVRKHLYMHTHICRILFHECINGNIVWRWFDPIKVTIVFCVEVLEHKGGFEAHMWNFKNKITGVSEELYEKVQPQWQYTYAPTQLPANYCILTIIKGKPFIVWSFNFFAKEYPSSSNVCFFDKSSSSCMFVCLFFFLKTFNFFCLR